MTVNSSYIDEHIALPDYAMDAISSLEQAGFEAWCVGGCVRDALLGRPVNDYDIATSAPWSATENTLAARGFTVHRTGTKHGTVTASINGHAMEITTYRTDGAYSDGRHPDSVRFVSSIEDDLARRDFTINAMAYHPHRGLLDCYGGIQDLDRRIIRAVGDADKRFTEDALRILRGCRFSSQLGFSIEPATRQSMWSRKMRMSHISSERITHELTELLMGDHVHDALVECVDILGAVLPEIVAMKGFDQHTPYHIYDVWEHTAWVVQYSPHTRLARWVALLHDAGKPGAFFMDGYRGHFYGHPLLSAEVARGVFSRMALAPAFTADALTLIRLHDKTIQATPKSVRRALADFDGNVELFRTLIGIKRADAMAQSPLGEARAQLAERLERILDEIIAADDAFSIKQLAINGNDILDLGVSAGPTIGHMLQQLLDAVVDESVANNRDSLLQYAEKELRGSRRAPYEDRDSRN